MFPKIKDIQRAIFFFLMIVTLAGCRTHKEATNLTQTERVFIREKKINLPAFDLRIDYPLSDTLKIQDTVFRIDPRTGYLLKLYRDSINVLRITCEGVDTVTVTRVEYRDRESTSEKESTKNRSGFFQILKWLLIGLVSGWLLNYLYRMRPL